MPLYEFRCQECGTVFEVHATIREKSAGLKLECPECQGTEIMQVLRAPMLSRVGVGGGGGGFGCGPGAGPGCCG